MMSSLQGVNVREKAKIVMLLIRDEEKRKEEREFAMKTKDKLATGNILFQSHNIVVYLSHLLTTKTSGTLHTGYTCAWLWD